MTVRSLGTALASKLHAEHLKVLGFKKSGATFSRARNGYVESLNLQGSSWNSGEEPWLFYVNIRVLFTDLPDVTEKVRNMKYHAEGRLESIVPESPSRFELTAANLGEIVGQVSVLSQSASARLPGLLAPLRSRASRGLYAPIPLPAAWAATDDARAEPIDSA
jgi:hypothetical protein